MGAIVLLPTRIGLLAIPYFLYIPEKENQKKQAPVSTTTFYECRQSKIASKNVFI